MTTDQTACPNCTHPHHLPGTECQTPVHHGPNRWHLCLCLARPGAALSCPPQMTCQGGTLGYADVWYLQHGHTLLGEDGEIAPAVFETGVASVGFPSGPDISAAAVSSVGQAPATDRAALRDRVAEALMRWAERSNDPQYASIRRPSVVRENAYSRADAVIAVLPELAEPCATSAQPAHWRITPTHLDLFVRALINHVDYDIHKGYLCGEEDGEDHYPELVEEAAQMLDAITSPDPSTSPAVGGAQQPKEDRTVLPCNWARTRTEHTPHDWEPQPGMDPVHCPGFTQEADRG